MPSLDNLRRRAEMLAAIRAFFAARSFLEVETPLLSNESVVDQHLDPLMVTAFGDPRQPHQGPTLYLQTSPELAMKRLLAAGFPSIYQICKAFRGAEQGERHNAEFTIAEWYGVGDGYQQGMELLGDLVQRVIDCPPPQRITWREMFIRDASIDPARATLDDWRNAAQRLLPKSLDDAWRNETSVDAWCDLILTQVIEPRLGHDLPTIVYDYPATQSALAQVRSDKDWPVAERFELYIDGVELANGYHELLDVEVMAQRIVKNNAARRSDGKPELPVPERLLSAMKQGLPQCSGCALGFDRLVMVATKAKTIAEVMAYTTDQA
jgi:lysyl-tRNA synthetase class 2